MVYDHCDASWGSDAGRDDGGDGWYDGDDGGDGDENRNGPGIAACTSSGDGGGVI